MADVFDFDEIKCKIRSGRKMKSRRTSWGDCKIIRSWQESDEDFVPGLANTKDVIMEECDQKVCDCRISVFAPTQDDLDAQDYIIL